MIRAGTMKTQRARPSEGLPAGCSVKKSSLLQRDLLKNGERACFRRGVRTMGAFGRSLSLSTIASLEGYFDAADVESEEADCREGGRILRASLGRLQLNKF